MQEPEQEEAWPVVIIKCLGIHWRTIFLIFWPFVCLNVFFISFEEEIRCLFVVMLLAGYWVTESLPLYVTGMLPVVLLPVLGVQDTGDVCQNYLNQTNMIFLASLFISSGIEHCGLHKRIAYSTIMLVGCSPRKLHFGLNLVTALLSVWLLNSAATAMMCPIIHAILGELEAQGIGSVYKPKDPNDAEDEPPRPTNITVAYFLSAAYASTIGGIGSLVGTATNLTYKGLYETRFPDGNKIEFVAWLLFDLPPMILMTLACWLILEFLFMGLWRKNSEESQIIKAGAEHNDIAYRVMRQKTDELGKMSWNEIGVLILFSLCILLWFGRKPQFIPGWGDLYKTKIADATPAIGVIALFLALPGIWSFIQFFNKLKSKRPAKVAPPLVPWKVLQDKMPWGLLFLLGGGSALASAGKKSGMSKFLGEKLIVMENFSPLLVLGITSLMASMATELTSNVATCNIIVPVLIEMSIAMNVHPVQFTFPAAVQCSFAFLMPVGTPPNAIVVEHANIRTIDMMKGGFLLKIFCWLIYVVLFPTYGRLFYEQGSIPQWALDNDNSTSTF